MGVIVTELAVQGDFCYGLPAVAESAFDAAAMLSGLQVGIIF